MVMPPAPEPIAALSPFPIGARHQFEGAGPLRKSGKPAHPGKTRRQESASDLRQRDFDSDIQGKNKLQGKDQLLSRNERRSQPSVGGASGGLKQPTGRSGEI